jgi:Zn-dependent peptidase ImmA (M78 family)
MNNIDGFIYETGEKQSETKAARIFGGKIAKEASFLKPPIDVFSLIENKYGIKIRKLSLNEEISAIADLDQNEIIINSDKPYFHTRFTAAHELGHILLNHKQRKWTEYSANINTSNPNKKIEEEANAFAAGLLMPEYLIKKLANKKTTPVELAKLFEVSQEAMWYSIQYYRLINRFI